MRFLAKFVVPSVAVSLLLAACGSSSSTTTTTSSAQPASQSTGSSGATVKTASSSLGTILVDSKGMTLYHLSGENGSHFICTNSACTGIWHPLTVTSGTTPSGQSVTLTTVKRPDGTTQVAYEGEPLYTFASDQQPGETKGQGFKDVGTWTVIKTSGSAPAAATTQTETTEKSSGGGGGGAYGY